MTTRFDIYRLPRGRGFVVDCQSDLIDELGSRVVIPLIPMTMKPMPITRLHPRVQVDGLNYSLATHLLVAIPLNELGSIVGSLAGEADAISAALDILFIGF